MEKATRYDSATRKILIKPFLNHVHIIPVKSDQVETSEWEGTTGSHFIMALGLPRCLPRDTGSVRPTGCLEAVMSSLPPSHPTALE